MKRQREDYADDPPPKRPTACAPQTPAWPHLERASEGRPRNLHSRPTTGRRRQKRPANKPWTTTKLAHEQHKKNLQSFREMFYGRQVKDLKERERRRCLEAAQQKQQEEASGDSPRLLLRQWGTQTAPEVRVASSTLASSQRATSSPHARGGTPGLLAARPQRAGTPRSLTTQSTRTVGPTLGEVLPGAGSEGARHGSGGDDGGTGGEAGREARGGRGPVIDVEKAVAAQTSGPREEPSVAEKRRAREARQKANEEKWERAHNALRSFKEMQEQLRAEEERVKSDLELLEKERIVPKEWPEEPSPANKYLEAMFAPLTPAMDEEVDAALSDNGPSGEILVAAFNVDVSRKDIQCLCPREWLTDEVINFTIKLLLDDNENAALNCFAHNTFFYPKLLGASHDNYNYKNVRRWTKRVKVDLFEKDLVFIPVHLGVHWCMGVINLRAKRFEYYDSMGGRNPTFMEAARKYLADEHVDKKGEALDLSSWTDLTPRDNPQQVGGYDCGVFMLLVAMFMRNDLPLSFSQKDIPYFRRRMAWQVLNKTLSIA